MIVLSHNKGWKVITQRSHGLLAAMIANQYAIDLPNEIIVPTLIAIAEHDDGVAETKENKNLTEAGAPRHFLVPNGSEKTDLKQYFNVMELSAAKSQLNALLTSMHLDFIFSDQKNGADKELTKFLKEQATKRKEILKHLDIDSTYADRLYRFVEWCDAFSLLICLDKIQPEGRKMDVSENPDGVVNQTFYSSKNVIGVEPWVFKSDTFNVFYEYRIVEQLEFQSIEAFDDAFRKSSVEKALFSFSK